MKKLIATLAGLVLAGSVCAQSFTDIDKAQYYGKINIPKAYQVIDANFAKVEGGVSASGGATATWVLTYPSAQGTNTATETFQGASADGDYRNWQVLMYDESNDVFTAWKQIVVVDDVTSGTVDTAVEHWIMVNDTLTQALNIDASGVDCGAFKILATAGDLGDGDLDNVGAISADSIGADATALAVNTGTGEVTIDGKYAVTGSDASTALMLQKGNGTPTGATTQTNTFEVAFGSNPVVIIEYTAAPGADTAHYISSVSTTNFVCEVIANKAYSFIAIGTRQ